MTVEALHHRHDQVIPDDRGVRIWDALSDDRAPANNWNFTLRHPDWVQQAHNTRSGRVFILGTGPSLATQRLLLPRLAKEQTWTVNRAGLIDYLGFTPTHHSVTEPGPILEWGRRIHPLYDFPTALNRIAIHWFPVTAPGWIWCAKAPDDIQVRWHGFFGLDDRFPPLPTAWASPLTLAQLACWLGYQELYYLGVDTTQQGQAWNTVAGRTTYPRSILTIMECAARIRQEMERAGRRIVDCTPGGRLNQEGILPYVPLEEILSDHR